MSDDFATTDGTLRWWVMPYLMVLYWCAMLMRTAPKDEHVNWILAKGMRWVRTPCEPPN